MVRRLMNERTICPCISGKFGESQRSTTDEETVFWKSRDLGGIVVRTNMTLESLGALVDGYHQTPTDILGAHEIEHEGRKALAVRAFLPDSRQAWVVDPTHHAPRPMRRIHPAGVFEAICPFNENQRTRYQLRVARANGEMSTMHDPYSFASVFTDYDFHLFGEGNLAASYDKLGAHARTIEGVAGVNFSVWAPNAQGISVIGDFNSWDGRAHLMHKHVPSGIWELFIPDLAPGTHYKFRVRQETGRVVDKSDPYAFSAEVPPRTASIVTDIKNYQWNDQEWCQRRQDTNMLEQPISIFELHLGSWQKGDGANGWMNYRDIAHQLVEYCHHMNFTHVELLPVSEHPFTGSWGYQTTGYFGVTSRYGTPEDFMYFIDHCHQHGIGVILDWVPAHFPKDDFGLARFDGSALYEHADSRQGEHPDWGTLVFNYGRNEVRNFLVANALFWLDRYHIDGLRVDAVASMLYLDYSREAGEWIPNRHGGRENLEAIEFIKEFNERVHASHPGVLTIAEESTAWGGVSRPIYDGGLGFSLKWNMGWMNDTLRYMQKDPIHRSHHHGELTFSLIYAFTENFTLPLSHDEVVHGKGSLLDQMPGDPWQRFANLRLLYSYMWTHPGKKLLFMGSEFGQWNEWNEESGLQWDLLEWETHQGIQTLVSDLNRLYCEQPALHQVDFESHGFEWIDCDNGADSVISYVRRAKDSDDFLVVVCNFTPLAREGFPVGVPEAGTYRELFNSDSQRYGGTNVGTPAAQAMQEECHGRPHRILISLPPLGVSVLKLDPQH